MDHHRLTVSASPRLALVLPLIGALLMGLGLWLFGSQLDPSLELSWQPALRALPLNWPLLSWTALGLNTAVLLACLSAHAPRRVAAMLLSLVCTGLVVHLIKAGLHTPRPYAVFGPHHPGFVVIGPILRMGSMPSGHSATAWTMATLMQFGWLEQVGWRRLLDVVVRLACWPLAIAESLSRVAVGAHWPSDILVGAGLGLVLGTWLWRGSWSAALAPRLALPGARWAMAVLLPLSGALACTLPLDTELPVAWQLGWMLLCGFGAWQWRARAVLSTAL